MKNTILLALAFLFFAFTTKPLLGAADPVLDVRGDELQTGVDYFIVSLMRGGGGGGLTLAKTRNKTCPVDVIQWPLDIHRGLPFTFSPVNPEESVVRQFTDLNIKFSIRPICNQSPVLKLDNYDELTGQWFVTTGGVEGNPGPQTLTSWFKIEKLGSTTGYKLVFCPSVCNSCIHLCKDVGIYFEDGMRRLALSDTPFIVVFVKAEGLLMRESVM